MKFTLSWLKEYLKTDKDINTILETLTNIGLEVEEAFDQYSVYKAVSYTHLTLPTSDLV